jgi:hypothetical protein
LAQNPQKTILNGQEYENIPAEVVTVDFSGKNKEKLYTIYCKFLGAFGSQTQQNVVSARPLDANIKNIPVKGEVVMLVKGPTSYNSALRSGQEYYYTNPVSIQSSVHHNGIPGVTDFSDKPSTQNLSARKNAEDGATNRVESRLETGKTIDPGFPERLDVYPIQPYPGDIIIEGRWGNSIRLGSTVDERREYPQRPLWKKGLGDTGNPILIISNGTNPDKKPFNEFILEDPNNDDTSIWMTSGQSINFTPASTITNSIENRAVNLLTRNVFAGNQILLSSDRIILNAKKQELIGFSSEGIGFSSEKAIALDSGIVVEMESNRINLGINAVSPVLLGDKTMQWLGDLCDSLASLCTSISKQTHLTGTGESLPPTNAPDFNKIKSDIKSLRSSIKSLPSNLVFVCENPGGPTKAEMDKAKERAASGGGYVETNKLDGDKPDILAGVELEQPVVNVVTILTELGEIEKQKKVILEEISKASGASLTPASEMGMSSGEAEEAAERGDFATGSNATGSNATGSNAPDPNTPTTPPQTVQIPGSVSSNYPNGLTYEQLGLEPAKMKNIGGRWNYDGDVDLSAKTNPLTNKRFTEIPIPFGVVAGNFNCSNMEIKSLKNSPTELGGTFNCSGNQLESLQEGPKKAKSYLCKNSELKSLTGGPTEVTSEFDCANNRLDTLVGGPTKVGFAYRLDGNIKITSLRGISANGTLNPLNQLQCDNCSLTDATIFTGVNEIKTKTFNGGYQQDAADGTRIRLDATMIKEITGAKNIYV